MNGITNLRGMNKKHEETNYYAFDDKRKLKGTKDCILTDLCLKGHKTFTFSVRKMMTTKRQMPNVKSCY